MTDPCPTCHGEAVIATPMRNAPVIQVLTCSSCGSIWSSEACQTRNCRERAVQMCVECANFRCKGHGAGRSGVCLACVRRYQKAASSPRDSRWSRTASRD